MLQRQPVRARASGRFSAPATAPLATRHPWSLPGAASPAHPRFPKAEEPDLAPGLPLLLSTIFLVSTSGTPVSYLLVPSPKSHIFLARHSVSLSPKGTEVASSCRESGGRRAARNSQPHCPGPGGRGAPSSHRSSPPGRPLSPLLPSPPAAHSWAGGGSRHKFISFTQSHTSSTAFNASPPSKRFSFPVSSSQACDYTPGDKGVERGDGAQDRQTAPRLPPEARLPRAMSTMSACNLSRTEQIILVQVNSPLPPCHHHPATHPGCPVCQVSAAGPAPLPRLPPREAFGVCTR